MGYPEIQTKSLWVIDGEVYELFDIRVTCIESPEVFVTTAFFEPKNKESYIIGFEERIEKILEQPDVFKLYINSEI